MVGSISEIAISGVTVANKTYVLYDLVVFGMSSGIGIFLAQYYGANEQKKCRKMCIRDRFLRQLHYLQQ